MYSAQVLDHFQNPRGVGELARASAVVELQNPACGDVLKLSLEHDSGRIVKATFRAKGCVPAIACGSRLVELLNGLTIHDAKQITRDQLIAELGGLPQASQHAAALAIDALHSALKQLR